MGNKGCKVRYCPKCQVRLQQTYAKEEADYVVLTRKCMKCKEYSVHIVECTQDDYNKNVDLINALRNVMIDIE